MQEEAAIRDMESKELTERNEQLKRETGELRYMFPFTFVPAPKNFVVVVVVVVVLLLLLPLVVVVVWITIVVYSDAHLNQVKCKR